MSENSHDGGATHPSFAAELFQGRLRTELLLPYPLQDADDAREGDAFLDRLAEVLRAEVDPNEIDRTGEIPDAAVEALAGIGAFGIKIPREHGGLGLSQTNYGRAAMLMGSWCGNTTVLVSAHQSIGVPQPLAIFGTDEQKQRFLPRLARGELSGFALTEAEAGSDPANMATFAEPSEDGSHYLINGEKLWCTNGTRADLFVVVARTPSKVVKGKERRQYTAFVVDKDMPGVEVVARCHFMGLRALYAGVIRLTDVEVPRENVILDEGRGLKVALTTLNSGRLTLPSACVGVSKWLLGVARRFAAERVQWGAPIGEHEAIAHKIAWIAAHTFAQEAMTFYATALVDRGGADIRVEAAMCKMFGSEVLWRIVNETMQIRSGRGYETAASLEARGEEPIPVERALRDTRINMIFEGTSEIMRLFLAREALGPHLEQLKGALDPRSDVGDRAKAAARAGLHYASWYPRQWTPAPGSYPVHPRLRLHLSQAAATSRRLSRVMFHAVVRHGAALQQRQALLGRCVEIGTDLFAISATCARADALHQQGKEGVIELAEVFCREAQTRIEVRFRALDHNQDREAWSLAQDVLAGTQAWLEEGRLESPPE